jgi:hypothetical protein
MIKLYGNRDWEIGHLIQELKQIKSDSGNQPYHQLKKKIRIVYNSILNKEVA